MTGTRSLDDYLVFLQHQPLPVIDFTLERVLEFLAKIGNPHQQLPPVIHIAGTNGKGSTLAFLHAMLNAAGKSAHRYTSPHLVRFHERFIIADKEITDQELLPELQRLEKILASFPLTFFESTTVLAFMLFERYAADITLLETGMGGRLDATNVIEQPLATVITPIGMDHQDFLGDSLVKIAAEKAAIMKPHVPSIIGQQPDEALTVIRQYAQQVEAPLFCHGKDWEYHITPSGELHYRSPSLDITTPPPALSGIHQYHNAALAIATLDRLQYRLPVSPDAVIAGIQQARWPGRLQPVPEAEAKACFNTHHHLIIDGAHNPPAAEILAEWIRNQKQPVHVIMGIHHDKEAAEVIHLLAASAASLSMITIPEDTKAIPAQDLAELARHNGHAATAYPSLDAAIHALTVTEKEKKPILICGSLYLAGYVLGRLEKESNDRTDRRATTH